VALTALAIGAVSIADVRPAWAQSSLRFNGSNNYVTFGRADSLGVARFTVEAWFRREGAGVATTTGTGGVTSAIPLLTKGRGEAEASNVDMNFFLGLRSTDNVLVADYEEGTGQTSPGLNHPVVGVTRINTNTWHHAAATFDGTTLTLYLNGSVEATVVVGANRLPQSASIQHAALATALNSTGVAAGFFQGSLDEARVWNRARTQQAIRDSLGLEITSAPGLRGRWGLNENGGMTAGNSVATAPNGTLVNSPQWIAGSTFALPGALGFAGTNDVVRFGNAAALGLGSFTLETWFRRDGAGVTANTGTGGVLAIPLVTKGVGEQDGSNLDMNYFLGIRGTDGVLVADFEEGAGGSSPGLNHPVAGSTPIVNGTWYHAAATYDGTAWRLYLNGALDGSLTVGQPPQAASIQHAGLGSALNSTGTASGFLHGALDEARVWDHARSQAQVVAAMNAQITTGQEGLVGRWALDEAAGSAVNGSAATTVNGVVSGTGWGWVAAAPFDAAPPMPPSAPTGLAATALTHAQVQIDWTDSSSNESGFEIERSNTGSGGPFVALATVAANVQTYTDPNRDGATEYCYRVRATNPVGPSAWTDVACATTPAEGAFGLDFIGTDAYVTFGPAPALALPAWTVETWFRRDGAGVGTTTGTNGIASAIPLVAKGRNETEASTVDMNWFLGIDANTGVLVADLEEGSGGVSPGRNHPVSGTTPIQTGVWYHAAATYDGDTWRLYLNGELETQLSVGQPAQSSSIQHAAIGSALNSTGVPAGFFDGVADEVRVWDNARTLSQIRATINQQFTASQAGLVARYGLNEGTGSAVNGGAGTTVNGTIVGTGWSWTGGAPFDLVINDPPNAPILVAPLDMSSGIPTSPTLEVTVTDPENDPMTVEFWGRPTPAVVPNNFTLIALPDTQYYVSALNGGTPAMFSAQTQWIVDNRAARDIAYVAQLGDCVEHGDNGGDPIEWQRADAALSLLEDPMTTTLVDGIPYGVAVGNHDQSPMGDPSGTTTFYNQYFGAARFAGRAYYGGHYGANNDNHFDLFSASGMDFIVITLEFDQSANSSVLAWADSLLGAYPSRRAILTSHYFMNAGFQASFGTQGQLTYTALRARPNLFLMLCGHVSTEGQRTDTFAGNTVHTLLSDYQGRTNGGNGWMRILEFVPASDEIRVKTYSPTLSQFENDADSDFTLSYPMQSGNGFKLLGTVSNVDSGESAQLVWPNLAPGAEYEWYAVAKDAEGESTSPTWRFTTVTDYVIVASAGAGGTITPSGSVPVAAGADQSFTITPDAGAMIAGVLVDGNSVGAVPSYTFTSVMADHTIAASFTVNQYTLTIHVAGNGSVLRDPDQSSYAHGSMVLLTPSPGPGFAFTGWSGDVTGTDDPLAVAMTSSMTITATFADVQDPSVQVTSPNGTESLDLFTTATLTWDASDNAGVTLVDLELSRSGPGGPFEPIATGIGNAGTYEWAVTGPGTTDAWLRVTAHDAAANAGSDQSDAAFEIRDTVSSGDEGPITEVALRPVAPNPMIAAGRVSFALPQTTSVRLRVLDVRGRVVAVLAEGERRPGRYAIRWNGETWGGRASSGVYFIELQAAGKRLTRRVMVMR
jgi:hypothetical protein